ncbi:hypothetical protein IF1G_07566 [Cordyceps javanica]|uniref:Uncharacterized protein n=1 Tax=Cordyceps javanica TaxID=43265 RepID=A0A545UWJ7_9HYPO|nr:hypothetical protein IF1G_07566 [Cordyceps javanica]
MIACTSMVGMLQQSDVMPCWPDFIRVQLGIHRHLHCKLVGEATDFSRLAKNAVATLQSVDNSTAVWIRAVSENGTFYCSSRSKFWTPEGRETPKDTPWLLHFGSSATVDARGMSATAGNIEQFGQGFLDSS